MIILSITNKDEENERPSVLEGRRSITKKGNSLNDIEQCTLAHEPWENGEKKRQRGIQHRESEDLLVITDWSHLIFQHNCFGDQIGFHSVLYKSSQCAGLTRQSWWRRCSGWIHLMQRMHPVWHRRECSSPENQTKMRRNSPVWEKRGWFTCKMSAWLVWVLDKERNSLVVIRHRSRFSGETKSSAILMHEWKFFT